MQTAANRWRYNPKLRRWYHPTSARSDNGPHDPPAEIEGNGPAAAALGWGDRLAVSIKRATRGRLQPCGGCRKRQSWLNRLGARIAAARAKLRSFPGKRSA